MCDAHTKATTTTAGDKQKSIAGAPSKAVRGGRFPGPVRCTAAAASSSPSRGMGRRIRSRGTATGTGVGRRRRVGQLQRRSEVNVPQRDRRRHPGVVLFVGVVCGCCCSPVLDWFTIVVIIINFRVAAMVWMLKMTTRPLETVLVRRWCGTAGPFQGRGRCRGGRCRRPSVARVVVGRRRRFDLTVLEADDQRVGGAQGKDVQYWNCGKDLLRETPDPVDRIQANPRLRWWRRRAEGPWTATLHCCCGGCCRSPKHVECVACLGFLHDLGHGVPGSDPAQQIVDAGATALESERPERMRTGMGGRGYGNSQHRQCRRSGGRRGVAVGRRRYGPEPDLGQGFEHRVAASSTAVRLGSPDTLPPPQRLRRSGHCCWIDAARRLSALGKGRSWRLRSSTPLCGVQKAAVQVVVVPRRLPVRCPLSVGRQSRVFAPPVRVGVAQVFDKVVCLEGRSKGLGTPDHLPNRTRRFFPSKGPTEPAFERLRGRVGVVVGRGAKVLLV